MSARKGKSMIANNRFIRPILIALTITGSLPAQSLQSILSNDIDIVVAPDNTGDYTKVQDAINAIPDNNPSRMVIFIKKGTYREKLIVPWKKTHLTLVGEQVDSTIITYNDASLETVAMNTFTSHSMRIDADYFEAMNLTISNTATSAQAVALHANGDCQTFLHCRIKGWQDTYFNNIRTRNYFKDCFMEGAVDYLFGFGIALFDSCLINTIRTVRRSNLGKLSIRFYLHELQDRQSPVHHLFLPGTPLVLPCADRALHLLGEWLGHCRRMERLEWPRGYVLLP